MSLESRTIAYPISLLGFWIKGQVTVTASTVKTMTRNTIFGFIPAGKNEVTLQIESLHSANLHTSYKVLPMIIGVFIFLGSFSLIGEPGGFFGMLLMMLIGFCIFGNGFKQSLVIERDGKDFAITTPFYGKDKLLEVQDAVEEAIAEHNRQRSAVAGAEIQASATREMADAIVSALKKNDQQI